MRHLLVLTVAASALLCPATALAQAAPALRDFSLPPAPSPSASPRVQGPVDTDAPVPVTPRVIATAAPRPAATATATPVQRPPLRLPEAASAPATTPRATATAAQPRPQPQTQPRSPAEAPRAGAERDERAVAPVLPPPPSILAPRASPSATAPQASAGPILPVPRVEPATSAPGEGSLTWALLGALATIGLVAGALWWRRRSGQAPSQVIDKPFATKPGAANDDQPANLSDALKVELTAVKLTRSFRNATLAYRVTLHNRSPRALEQVAVAGELIGAHGSQPLENQIASSGADLPELHRVERLSLGQSRTLDGTLTLPLEAIVPIRQGSAALFVPLFRLVVAGTGMEPLARTFVVGQPSAGATGRLTPFRLDEPPRSYQPIGQRALD